MRNLMMMLFLFSVLSSLAQERYKLKLQSGVYELTEIESDNIFNPNSAELVGFNYYRILTFNSIPSEGERRELGRLGVSFHSYLPENSFIAEIDSRKNISIESFKNNLQSAIPFSPEMKFSRRISQNIIPDYAWENDRVKIMGIVYEDLNSQTVNPLLKSLSEKCDCEIEYSEANSRIELTIEKEDIVEVAKLPFVYHVQYCEAPADPENYRGRTNHRVNAVSTSLPNSFSLSGNNVVVGHGDDGDIGPHIDFRGRLTSIAGPSNGNHGDHVAGTIFGAGNLDPYAKGMAPGAEIYYSSYPTNLNSVDNHYSQYAVRITSSSYGNGCNAGYTSYSQTMDKDIRDNYSLMHVFSCGNSGTSNCNYGAGAGWGNITGGHKQGKNVIATGNLNYQDVINNSSSRGPADDGRIKPDVCAIGTNVYSSNAGNIYNISTGTSMACPGVSGSLALMYEKYKDDYSMEPPGGLMKSILMNTAEDLGNPGPDFTYGYGRINVLRAVETIDDEFFIIDTISQNQQDSMIIQVPNGVKELRVMLYWTDRQGNPTAANALVNNLDIVVTDVANQTQYLPWVLDPTPNAVNLNSPAVRNTDALNNVEQVTLENPSAGSFKVHVSGTSVPFGPQEYYIVYYFVEDEIRLTHPFGGEHWDPTEVQTIRWDATPSTASFDLEYSLDSGQTWNLIASGIPANQNYFDWNPQDSLVSANAFIRISRGSFSTTNEQSFDFIQAPDNLKIDWACGDSIRMSWRAVPGATEYVLYKLGSKYMEPIDTVQNNNAILKGLAINSKYWLSVRAMNSNDLISIRAYAIAKTIGMQNCPVATDAGVSMIVSPKNTLLSCQNLSSIPLTISVKNYGLDPIYNIPVNYKINGGTAVTEFIADTLASYDSLIYTFNQNFALTGIGNQTIQAYTSLSGDLKSSNNSITSISRIYSSNTISMPYVQNFNNMTSCPTTNNCGATICNLSNGWVNVANGVEDGSDWRVNSGSTPSVGTGPTSDVSGNGKYLYLEASNGCYGVEALLISPCINLDSANIPELEFSYHMMGNSMGELHLDVIVDGIVEYDIIPPLVGEQGSSWLSKTVYLVPYIGKTINLQFRGITGTNWQSDISIDHIKIQESNMTIPSAQFSVDSQSICVLDTVVFSSTSSGIIMDYQWDFGSSAIPSNASGEGPHAVYYSQAGSPNASLKVSNFAGLDSSIVALNVDSLPLSDYSFTSISSLNYQFTDQSLYNPTSWLWLFGDGNQSTLQNPVHSYSNSGNYVLTLIATNDCGSDTLIENFLASGIGVEEPSMEDNIKLFPNPATDQVTIEYNKNISVNCEVRVVNSLGQEVYYHEWNTKNDLVLNTSSWSSGVYFVQIKSDELMVKKLVIH